MWRFPGDGRHSAKMAYQAFFFFFCRIHKPGAMEVDLEIMGP